MTSWQPAGHADPDQPPSRRFESWYKGQQLGTKLMKHALRLTQQVSTQIGGFVLYLDADRAAMLLYRKLGFTLLMGDRSPKPPPMFLPLAAIP